jgi:hypothetical protein
MSKQIQTQASKLWQTITDPSTAETYQKTGTLTWTILKETGYLLWLIVCLVLVAGDWFWKFSYGTGFRFRNWINNLDQPRSTSGDVWGETGKNLLEVSKTGLAKAVATAREQLGIEATPAPLEVPTPAPVPPAAAPAAATPKLTATPEVTPVTPEK